VQVSVESNTSSPDPVELKLRVDAALTSALQRFDARLAAEAGTREIRPLVQSFLNQPGKRLRPLLLVAAYRTFAGFPLKLPEALFDLAAALELFHAFILMHDDVIDASESRRGEATLHKRFRSLFPTRPKNAEHMAIVLGDMLFGFSIEQFLARDAALKRREEALRYFLQTVESTGLGEVIELAQTETPLGRVEEETIRTVYQLKTTRYTVEGPLVLGAYLAGASDAAIEGLKTLARPIGFAFQVENDLHEINLPEKKFAALAHDFRTGIKTYVLFRLQQALSENERRWLENFLRHAPGGPGDVPTFQKLVEKSGIRETLATEVRKSFSAGRAAVSQAAFSATEQAALHQILDQILQLRFHSEAAAPASFHHDK
jgi:geranylgeranyl diphosphate synthase type I